MSDEPANGLHLPNLTVSNFRGIGSLAIERLGRVTPARRPERGWQDNRSRGRENVRVTGESKHAS